MIVKKPKQWLQSQSQAQANYHFQSTMNQWNSWSNLPVFTNQWGAKVTSITYILWKDHKLNPTQHLVLQVNRINFTKPTPIPCFFSNYWQSINSPFFRANEKTNFNQSNGMITFDSHLKTTMFNNTTETGSCWHSTQLVIYTTGTVHWHNTHQVIYMTKDCICNDVFL